MRLLIILILLSCNTYANTYYNELHFQEEPQRSRARGQALDRTRNALMRFKIVRQRTEYFTRKIKSMTFGDYTEDLFFFAPFISGDFEFNVSDINVYYSRNNERAGLRYRFKF